MPESSQELRQSMKRRFGDAIDSSGPMRFLKERGYTLTDGWEWSKPGISDLGQMDRDEFECLLFLAHEWDFGGLAAPATKTDGESA